MLFAAIFVSSALSQEYAWFALADEVIVIYSLLVSIFQFDRLSRYSGQFAIISVFIAYTLIMSYFSPFYQGFYFSVLDLFLFLKPVILFFSLLCWSPAHLRKLRQYIYFSLVPYLAAALIFFFLDNFIDIFPPGEVRFGIESYEFIAANEGEFANLVMVAGLAIYALAKNRTIKRASLLTMTFLSLSSLRFKAIVTMIALWLLIFIPKKRLFVQRAIRIFRIEQISQLRFRIGYLIFIVPVALAFGASQFVQYFMSGATPRSFLLQNAVKIAGEYFPFGAGAGTYGSAVAKLQYSELYTTLGFFNKWGLSEADGRFLNDSFWPMVIAQYGVIGLILIMVIYTRMTLIVFRRWSFRSDSAVASLVLLLNLILSTLGSAILLGGLGALIISVLILIMYDDEKSLSPER